MVNINLTEQQAEQLLILLTELTSDQFPNNQYEELYDAVCNQLDKYSDWDEPNGTEDNLTEAERASIL